MEKQKVLELFKNDEDFDPIASRLFTLSELLNNFEESDDCLEMVHNKVLEALDWYTRYCDRYGFKKWWEPSTLGDNIQDNS
jgi:hypothetical protein